jgi:transposase
VVHRRELRPREPSGRWSAEKGGPVGEPDDHALGRSRGGFGTKFHLMTAGNGVPLAVTVSPGQRHDSKFFEQTVDAVPLSQARWPDALSGDKAYNVERIRRWLDEQGIADVIPSRVERAEFDRETYRRRNVVERCVGWLKECRRVATRFEKLALHFLEMLKVAFIQRYLRLLDCAATRSQVRESR